MKIKKILGAALCHCIVLRGDRRVNRESSMESVAFEERHPFNAYLFRGHLDENEVREALEAELGDKDHVERLMRREPIHTYGKPLPQGTWWLTPDPKPRQRTVPVTLIG